MNIGKQKAFFRELDKEIRKMGLETVTVEGSGAPQVGDTLRFFLPVTDDGDLVLMEIAVVALTRDTDLVQFYTTVLMEIGPGYDQLAGAINEWNFYCPVGTFGIFGEGRQLYHKYAAFVYRDPSAREMANDAMETMTMVYDAISERFPEAARLSAGGN